MIKPMDLVFTPIITEADTKDSLVRINNTVMASNNGPMVRNTKVNMNKA